MILQRKHPLPLSDFLGTLRADQFRLVRPLSGTPPSTFLFLLGRAHAISEGRWSILLPVIEVGSRGARERVLQVYAFGPVAQLVRARA
jgi:hypothetical protein